MPVGLTQAGLDLAVIARLVGDEPLGMLVKGVRAEWPRTLLEKPAIGAVPLVTIVRVRPVGLGDGPDHVELQSDVWVWPSGTGQGRAQLDLIDERMLELLGWESAVHWYDVAREIWVSSICVESTDPREADFLRRRRVWQVAPA